MPDETIKKIVGDLSSTTDKLVGKTERLVDKIQSKTERFVGEIQGRTGQVVGELQGRTGQVVGDLQSAAARHKERNQPSGFRFAISDSIAMLRPDHWDAVVAGSSVFHERAYLELLEAEGPPELSGRYALVYRGDTPVAAVAAQIVEVRADQLVPNPDEEGPADRLSRAVLGELRERVLICGSLLSCGNHGAAIREGESREDIWPGIAEALYRIRRADKLKGQPEYTVVKEIPETMLEDLSPLERFSYRTVDVGAAMTLEVRPEWETFDDYLQSLTSKYRRTIRKIGKSIADAGWTVAQLDDLEPVRHELHALYMNVVQRAGVRLAPMTPGYLAGMRAWLGERLDVTAIKKGDRIAAFTTTIIDGDRALGYYLGVDYEVNAEIPLYFRLLQTTIENGLDAGCTSISLGRTTPEPKASLGAEPVSTFVYMRHRVGALNALLRELFVLVPHEEVPERNPFKKAPEDPPET